MHEIAVLHPDPLVHEFHMSKGSAIFIIFLMHRKKIAERLFDSVVYQEVRTAILSGARKGL